MTKTKLYLLLSAALALSACATPTVVQVTQPGDKGLSCAQLADGIREANEFEEKARKDRGVTGTNVAAAVLFWPALAGTYVNTEEAIEAARGRRDHLTRLAKDKSCE